MRRCPGVTPEGGVLESPPLLPSPGVMPAEVVHMRGVSARSLRQSLLLHRSSCRRWCCRFQLHEVAWPTPSKPAPPVL